MTLTVLVCAHSQSSFHDELLIQALRSLENQTYKNFETVIVLDECWEKTKTKIESKIKLNCKILLKEKKEGLSFAKNFGLSHIKSDLVCFLDADDLYIEDKIEKQIYFFRNNNVDFLGTHAFNRYIDKKEFFDSCFKINQYITHQEIKNVIEFQNVLTHGSIMVKKNILDELGGYNNIKGAEDWDLWKRAISRNFIFFQLPERLYVYTLGTSVPR